MAECRLATDVFPFCGVNLRIVRRDISGDGGDAEDASTGAASNQSADDDDDWMDPNFFDEGYSVAATTGFCRVWEEPRCSRACWRRDATATMIPTHPRRR